MVQKRNDDCLLEVFSLLCDQKPAKKTHAKGELKETCLNEVCLWLFDLFFFLCSVIFKQVKFEFIFAMLV